MIVISLGAGFSKPSGPTGVLRATVVDAKTGQPLIRATVQILSTRRGAMTKETGIATIINLQPGTYDAVAKYAGYEPQTIKSVLIKPGDTTEIRFKLATIASDSIIILTPGLVREKSTTGAALSKFAVSEVDVTTAGRDAGMGGYTGGIVAQGNGGYAVRGSRGVQNSIRINGFSTNDVVNAPIPLNDFNTAEYKKIEENEYKAVSQEPLSTFSIDVDGASYSNIRHFLTSGQMPPKDAVRIEEMVNYFTYSYPQPKKDDPFSITTEIEPCPWNSTHQLALIGLQGKKIEKENPPPANLTFLLDVSGSMEPAERLPLLKQAFKLLVHELRPQDRVSIVVYAGNAGLVLPPTTGEHKDDILAALDRLEAGGSTAGGAGIELAYATAKKYFDKSYNNRVILATDGDFNVGISNTGDLVRFIEEQRSSGIYLTTLGVGTDNYKDARLKELADKGNGNYYYIDNLLEAKKVFVTQLGGTLNAIAKDVKIQIEFNPDYAKGYRLIGYESRILAKEDFNNDKKDAGELGSGHTVTTLYELIPAGASDSELHTVDSLRYQYSQTIAHNNSNEMMMVKFRYKKPSDTTSLLISHPMLAPLPENDVHYHDHTFDNANLNFASAVAEFGMILRDSKFKGQASIASLLSRAKQFKGADAEGYRAEFIKLVELYQLMDKASK